MGTAWSLLPLRLTTAKLDPSNLPTVETRVQFYKPLAIHEGEKPYECEFSVNAAPNARKSNIEYDERGIVVRDIRGVEGEFTLEKNGFEIMKHQSTLQQGDYASRDIIENVYLPECIEIVRRRYDADEVFVLGFNV
jgi:hypothetical protein